MVRVLVGIPTYRRPEMLRVCLGSLEAQTFADFDIVVADNDPALHEGHDLAQSMGIRAIIVPEPGLASVRNAILRECHHYDYLAWLDDDMTAGPRWLELMLEHAADAVGCPVRFEGMSKGMRDAFWTRKAPSGPISILYGTGGTLVSTRFLWKLDYPGFDPLFNFTGGEDSDWFRRLKRMGAHFAWCEEAYALETVTPDRNGMGWFLRRQFRIGTCSVEIARRHGSVFRNIAKAGVVLALTPIWAIAVLVPRWRFDVLRAWVRAIGRVSALFGVSYQEYAARH